MRERILRNEGSEIASNREAEHCNGSSAPAGSAECFYVALVRWMLPRGSLWRARSDAYTTKCWRGTCKSLQPNCIVENIHICHIMQLNYIVELYNICHIVERD